MIGRHETKWRLSYVTFYGFDDNDDGNPTHLGTDVISHATYTNSANEDLGTYQRPGTLAADVGFLSPGTKAVWHATYRVMEDTCRECSEDWLQNKPHVDLYVTGPGPELAACQERPPLRASTRSGANTKADRFLTPSFDQRKMRAVDMARESGE